MNGAKRQRSPKPPPSYNGLTLEQWRADGQRLRWAQTDPKFRELLAVVTNHRLLALAPPEGYSESRILGRTEGYELALTVLHAMTTGLAKPHEQIEPTYEPDKFVPIRRD